jgi:hypothetical protein
MVIGQWGRNNRKTMPPLMRYAKRCFPEMRKIPIIPVINAKRKLK